LYPKTNTMKYDVISPDGFSIHPTDTYKTKAEATYAFKQWLKRYEKQGYYSSSQFGRIPLNEVIRYCKIVEL
jgi:hypothetical protein